MNRKFLNILLVLLLTVASVFIGSFLADKQIKGISAETTVSKQAVTENEGDRVLLAENNDKDYHFYSLGKKLILVHSDKEYEYDDVIDDGVSLDKPVMEVIDVNSDGTDELLLQVGAATVNDEIYHSVYAFSYYTNDTGDGYRLTAINENSASTLLDRFIQIQLTQDKDCPKNCLFAMSSVYDPIKFNRDTGIPEDSYYYMFKASQDKDGNYYTLLSWSRDKINCNISSDNSSYVDIVMPVRISYKETEETFNVGFVKFQTYVTAKGEFGITPKTMEFCAYKEYGVYKYNFDEEKYGSWTGTVNNSNRTVPRDKVIDFIQYDSIDFTADVTTDNFAKSDSDLNCISSIKADENGVELTAKAGCTFNKELANSGQYSVNLYATRENTINTYDISYTAAISKDGDGNEVLKINFDKKYRQNIMKKIAINFGVK